MAMVIVMMRKGEGAREAMGGSEWEGRNRNEKISLLLPLSLSPCYSPLSSPLTLPLTFMSSGVTLTTKAELAHFDWRFEKDIPAEDRGKGEEVREDEKKKNEKERRVERGMMRRKTI
jgi:hypothetical protein